MMRTKLSTFLSDQGGAVTADYVVLAATVVGMGFSSAGSIRNGVGTLGGQIEASLSYAQVMLLCSQDGSLGALCDEAAPDGDVGDVVRAANILLYYDQNYFDTVRPNLEHMSDEDLNAYANGNVQNTSTYLESGSLSDARMYIDIAYLAISLMEERGVQPWGDAAEYYSVYDKVASS